MPLGESMLISLRNNEQLKHIREKFSTTFLRKPSKQASLFDFPKATPELLQEIRLKKRIESKDETIHFLLSIIIVLVIVLLFLV